MCTEKIVCTFVTALYICKYHNLTCYNLGVGQLINKRYLYSISYTQSGKFTKIFYTCV